MSVQITGIDHVVLNCQNVAVTAAWYVRALDLNVVGYGEGRTALFFGNSKINLREVGTDSWGTARTDVPGALDICFATAQPISEVEAAWEAAGIPVYEGRGTRQGAHGPMSSIYARDPDGNLVEVASYESEQQ